MTVDGQKELFAAVLKALPAEHVQPVLEDRGERSRTRERELETQRYRERQRQIEGDREAYSGRRPERERLLGGSE